jgi:hypothetical protein
VVLAGHPKLRNDLRKDTMEEIGYRTDVFSLDGIVGAQREYIAWLLGTCAASEEAAGSILTDDAVDLLASKLRTPLQVQLHLALALEAGYQAGERPVSVEVVESGLSRHIDDLEPTLTRNGYCMKDLVEQFGGKVHEFKALFNNTLDPERVCRTAGQDACRRDSPVRQVGINHERVGLATTLQPILARCSGILAGGMECWPACSHSRPESQDRRN